jgi:hypothetical protein
MEQSKREIETCSDTEYLRKLCFQMLELLDGQRQMFLKLVKETGLEPG